MFRAATLRRFDYVVCATTEWFIAKSGVLLASQFPMIIRVCHFYNFSERTTKYLETWFEYVSSCNVEEV